ALSLRYIHKDFRKQLQDVDVNHHTRIDPRTGQLADQIGEDHVSDNIPDGIPDLYIDNFFFNRIYHLGNYNRETYRAWEVELVRRLHRKWQLEASYTYSVAKGDAESYLSSLGADAARAESEPGYLRYGARTVIKPT